VEKIKFKNIFILWWVFLLSAGFFLLIPNEIMASSPGHDQLETSVVLLVIKKDTEIIFQDPFFELLDLEGYLLVPINSLAPKLGLEVSYRRSENKVIITEATNGLYAEVFIDEGVYRIEGELVWPDEPPLLLNRDFYISIHFLESVAGVKITWDDRYQELTITTDRAPLRDGLEETKAPEKSGAIREKEPSPQEGPTLSLSAIRYEVALEHRRDQFGPKKLDGILKLRTDGRAEDWSLSAGGRLNYDFYDHFLNPDLTLLRAKYNEDNELIILGNSHLDLEKTIEKKDLWGALYMNPDHQPRKQVVAYTDLSGHALEGDEVQLYLNDRLFKTQLVSTEGMFLFKDVPLRIKRVNLIRIVIHRKNGEILQTIQKISACPRLVKVDTNEILIATGLYKQDNKEQWEGVMIGFRNRIGVTEHTTVDLETAMTSPYRGEQKQNFLGTDAGIAFRINNNLICTLDWLLGGDTQTTIESGAEASLLYCLENGYFETIVFYIPGAVSQGVKVSPGRGEKVIGELEFNKNITLKTEGYLIDSPPDLLNWSLKGGNLTLSKKFGKYQQSSIAGGLKKEWKMEETEEGTLEAIETGSSVKYTLRERGIGSNAKGSFTSIDYTLNKNANHNLKLLNLQGDLTKSFSDTVLVGLALDTLGTWLDQSYEGLQLEGASEIKWGVMGDTIIIGNYTIKGKNTKKTDFSFKAEEVKIGLSFLHFFPNHLTLLLDANRIFQQLQLNNSYLFTTAGVSIHYRWPDDSGIIAGKIGYRSPVGTRKFPQWSYVLSLQKFLPSDLMLKLEYERLYGALWDEVPEYLIRLSLNHALCFTNGEFRTFRYSEEDNTSMIKGVVYLDENGNGQFDPWEKRLSGIVMSVEGRRATTNEDGEYTFNFLKPGIYRIDFNPRSLPADYTPVTSEQLIRLRENENFFLDFGVTLNGSISGLVFIDANTDGKMNENEKPLDWVGILLDHGDQKTFTGPDGSFYFEGIPLGDHTVSLDPESLPAGLQLAGKEEFTILLTEDVLDVVNLLFPLVYKVNP